MALSPALYARARQLFHDVLAVPKTERSRTIAELSAANPDVWGEVESLLRYHESEVPAHADALPPVHIAYERSHDGAVTKLVRRVVGGRYIRIILAVLLLLTIILGGKAGRDHLQGLLKQQVHGQLTTVLNSNVQSLELWKSHRFADVARWAADPRVVRGVEALVSVASSTTDLEQRLRDAPAQQDLLDLFRTTMASEIYEHFVLFDANLVTLSSDALPTIGLRLAVESASVNTVVRVFQGEQIFRPRRAYGSAYRAEQPPPDAVYHTWFSVPVRRADGTIIASLSIALDPIRYLDEILRVGRWGDSGETYAFDPKGRVLTSSRFKSQLQASKALPDGRYQMIGVDLKDPGGNLLDGFVSELAREDQPFTRAVSRALTAVRTPSGQTLSGELLEPYRDYRGVEVIGTWRWSPAFDYAVITEIDADEALAFVHAVNALYIVLVTLAAAAVALAFASTLKAMQLRRGAKIGARMGQYKLIRKVAEGGIGEVYLARHELLKRPTAIKILKPDASDPGALNRFEHEVRATSRLTHPNTVAVYDFGRTEDGSFYYAMEFLVGVSLAKLIAAEPRMPAERAVYLLLQMTLSLREAHQLGLIHRDIKPLNIMVCRIGGDFDVIKVVDFGLVKNIKAVRGDEATGALTGGLHGTPAYMAPEVITDPASASPKSDIYSLGVVAFKMLTARNPFAANDEAGLLYDILYTAPRPIAELRPDLPASLAHVIMQCLAKKPDERPGSMDELARLFASLATTLSWDQEKARQWWDVRDHLIYGPGDDA